MTKIKLAKREFSRFKKHGAQLPLRFYLDEGLPGVREFLAKVGCDVVTAEESAGAGAKDQEHLSNAKKDFRIFVTRDERLLKREIRNGSLYNSPGILILHSPKGNQDDFVQIMFQVLRHLIRKPWDLYSLGIVISGENAVAYDATGESVPLTE